MTPECFPSLHYLSRGSEVVRLQLMLREMDYALEPDGFFGPMTREAVTTFQATHALAPTGRACAATWDRLENLFAQKMDMLTPAGPYYPHLNPDWRNVHEPLQRSCQAPERPVAQLAGPVPCAV